MNLWKTTSYSTVQGLLTDFSRAADQVLFYPRKTMLMAACGATNPSVLNSLSRISNSVNTEWTSQQENEGLDQPAMGRFHFIQATNIQWALPMCQAVFFAKKFYWFIFGHAGSLMLCRLFSSCGEPASLRRLLLLRSTGSRVHGLQQSWSTGLDAPWDGGSSWIRD